MFREEHYTLLRQTGSATGQKIGLVFLSQMPWRCTLKTLGFQSSLFQLSALSSSYRVQPAHFQAPRAHYLYIKAYATRSMGKRSMWHALKSQQKDRAEWYSDRFLSSFSLTILVKATIDHKTHKWFRLYNVSWTGQSCSTGWTVECTTFFMPMIKKAFFIEMVSHVSCKKLDCTGIPGL